jgi:hypothetical protein
MAAAAALGGTACGSESPKIVGKVQLTINSPSDGAVVRANTVTVSGRVRPASSVVLVEGRQTTRDGAAFQAEVDLADGTTVIDVIAQAPRRNPAVSAIRVRRPVTVVIPDLKDKSPDDAETILSELGLKTETKKSGGILDELFGGRLRVCGTDPDAGATVDVGSVVVLQINRSC